MGQCDRCPQEASQMGKITIMGNHVDLIANSHHHYGSWNLGTFNVKYTLCPKLGEEEDTFYQ